MDAEKPNSLLNKVHRNRPILLSPVLLQTELDSTQSFYNY